MAELVITASNKEVTRRSTKSDKSPSRVEVRDFHSGDCCPHLYEAEVNGQLISLVEVTTSALRNESYLGNLGTFEMEVAEVL